MKNVIIIITLTLLSLISCKKNDVVNPDDDNNPDPIERNSLYFDGSRDYLIVEDHDDLDLANKTYILEARVKPVADNYYQWFLSKAYLNDNMDYMLGIDRYNNQYRHISSSLSNDINANTQISNEWVIVKGVHNAENNTFSIYINGNLENEVELNSRSSKSNDNDLYIGARWYNSSVPAVEFLEGEIDYIKIWGRTNIANTLELADNSQFGLIAYWEMDKVFNENQIEDLSGNGHHATIFGNPVFKDF